MVDPWPAVIEIALQPVFGDSGFGLIANATLVNTNKPYDAAGRTTTGFAVAGLANSGNFMGFRDKYGRYGRRFTAGVRFRL